MLHHADERADLGAPHRNLIDPGASRSYITDRSVSSPVPTSPLTRPTRQRRKQARPQELLDAALELFVERGFAATRMEEVAALAGVSKGTLYLYHASKEDLLKAVIRERLSNEIELGATVVAGHAGTHAELLRELIEQWWLRVYDSPTSGVFKLIITEVRSFPDISAYYHREVVEPGKQLIGGVLKRGMAAGEFRRVNVEAAVHSLVLPMVMLCVHKHSLGACEPFAAGIDPHEFVRRHVELLLYALTVRRTSANTAKAMKAVKTTTNRKKNA